MILARLDVTDFYMSGIHGEMVRDPKNCMGSAEEKKAIQKQR